MINMFLIIDIVGLFLLCVIVFLLYKLIKIVSVSPNIIKFNLKQLETSPIKYDSVATKPTPNNDVISIEHIIPNINTSNIKNINIKNEEKLR